MYSLPSARGQLALRDLQCKAADKLYVWESGDGSLHKSTKQHGQQPLLQISAGGWSDLFWFLIRSGTSPLNYLIQTWQYDELLATTKGFWKKNTNSGKNHVNLHERASTTETVKNSNMGENSEMGQKNHQELAYYVTSHSIPCIWRSKRVYRNTFKTKETIRCTCNRHIISLKIMTNNKVISCRYRGHSHDSSSQLQLSFFQLGTG